MDKDYRCAPSTTSNFVGVRSVLQLVLFLAQSYRKKGKLKPVQWAWIWSVRSDTGRTENRVIRIKNNSVLFNIKKQI